MDIIDKNDKILNIKAYDTPYLKTIKVLFSMEIKFILTHMAILNLQLSISKRKNRILETSAIHVSG